MKEQNDSKLKLAMARLLPEKIHCLPVVGSQSGGFHYYWKDKVNETVLETEWLYVMHLVEQKLTADQEAVYVDELAGQIMSGVYEDSDERYKNSHLASDDSCYRATFNQRAAAMCKVKGIDYATN